MDSFERYISLPRGGSQCGEGTRIKGRTLGEEFKSHQSLGPFQIPGFSQFSFPLFLFIYLGLILLNYLIPHLFH